jgi:hypothetical protein
MRFTFLLSDPERDRVKLEMFEGQSPGNSMVLSVDLSKDRQEANL